MSLLQTAGVVAGRLVPAAARVGGSLLTAALTVVVARTGGLEYSGKFYLFVTAVSLASVFTRLGVDGFLTHRVVEGSGRSPRQEVAVSGLAVLLLTFLACAVSLAGCLVRPDLLQPRGVTFFWIAVLGVNSIWLMGTSFRAQGRAAMSVFVETGAMSAGLVMLVGVFAMSGNEPQREHIALALACFIPVFLFVVSRVRGRLEIGRGLIAATIRAVAGIARFGSVTLVGGLMVVLPVQILGSIAGAAEVGVYNAAFRASMLIGAFGVVIRSGVVKDMLSPGWEATAYDLRVVWRSLILWMSMAGVLWLVGARFVTDLLGEGFGQVRWLMLPLLLIQAVWLAGTHAESRLLVEGHTLLMGLSGGAAVVILVSTCLLLVPIWGAEGAVAGFGCAALGNRLIILCGLLNLRRRALLLAS